MKSNELKKGDMVRLRNGWKARIEDNLRGNVRLCTVYGTVTEMGSVYSHDIMMKLSDIKEPTKNVSLGSPDLPIEHTRAQNKLREHVGALGF